MNTVSLTRKLLWLVWCMSLNLTHLNPSGITKLAVFESRLQWSCWREWRVFAVCLKAASFARSQQLSAVRQELFQRSHLRAVAYTCVWYVYIIIQAFSKFHCANVVQRAFETKHSENLDCIGLLYRVHANQLVSSHKVQAMPWSRRSTALWSFKTKYNGNRHL